MAGQARSYSPARSEIRDAINLLLKWISWLLVPVGLLLVFRQLQSGQTIDAALRGSVAGLAVMVPEGLVLLTSVAMAVGVVRLAARPVLVQDLPAIEGLARVDVVCCDKTGTLTQGSMRVVSVIKVGTDAGADEYAQQALGALAAAEPRPNATMRALADEFADPGWDPGQVVAFSSVRKWSAASYDGQRTWLIGSPETLLAAALPHGDGDSHGVLDQAAAASFSAFLTIRDLELGLGSARTSATIVAVTMSLVVLAALARPAAGWRGLMVLALVAVFAGLFTLPWLREQLAIVVLPVHLVALSVGFAAVGSVLLLLAWPISRLIPAGNREPVAS